jgi:O-antigen chain-terminating methyltransferase
MIGPPLEAQRAFNSVAVDHAQRMASAYADQHRTIEELCAALARELDAGARFRSHLIQYLQTITWYVDTRDRSAAADAQIINAAVSALTDDWLKRWESLAIREARYQQAVTQVLGSFDDVRATAAIAQQTSLSLKREVQTLLERGLPASSDASGGEAERSAPDLDSFKYLAFENAFRGSPELIRQRLSDYLPTFEGSSDVLELGCGRGEFLELLREAGITARGLDINDAMVQQSRNRGLDVVKADALEYLTGLPEGSLGGLFAAQVVEHLQPSYLQRLIELAATKMRPGGVIVLETINPSCWVAFFESYIRDLTHVKPLHPETLQFLVRAAGFVQVEIEWRAPVGPEQQLKRLVAPADADVLEDVVERLNANIDALNQRLFGFQDYAVIGRR